VLLWLLQIGEAQLVQYEVSEQRRCHLLSRSLSFMENLWYKNSKSPQLDPVSEVSYLLVL